MCVKGPHAKAGDGISKKNRKITTVKTIRKL
jgi:hypothetical protein